MNEINDRIVNHRILQKLIEMKIISQSEVRRLVVEELLEEAPADSVRRWFGDKLRAISDPKQKLATAEKLLTAIGQALKGEQQFLAFMKSNFPNVSKKGDTEVIKQYMAGLQKLFKSQAPDGNPRSATNKLRAAAAASEKPKEKLELVAVSTALVAKQENKPVTVSDIDNALVAIAGENAPKNEKVKNAVVAMSQKVTGKPVEGTEEKPGGADPGKTDPEQAKAGVSNDPNLFDVNEADLEQLEDAYLAFRNKFYDTATLAQQGEIVKNFKNVLKQISDTEDKEAAFARTGGGGRTGQDKGSPLQEQEEEAQTPEQLASEEEQVRLKRLPNFKSDVRIFYDNARRSKKALEDFTKKATSGAKVNTILKKRLIRLINQLQKSTGRLAKDIDKITGEPEQPINEMMSAEERFEKAQVVERIHTEIVTSFDDLFKMMQDQLSKASKEEPEAAADTETPQQTDAAPDQADAKPEEQPQQVNEKVTTLSKDAVDKEVKKIFGLLDQIVSFFPNVKPFAGQVDFGDLNKRYKDALEDLDFSVSNLRTLNQDTVAKGTLVDLRSRLKLFSERLEEIFGIKAEVPGAKPTNPTKVEPLPKDPESPAPGEKDQESGQLTTRDPDAIAAAPGEEESATAQLEDGTLVPQSISQLATWFKTKLFMAPMVKAEIERMFPDGKGIESLAKFIAYVLVYKSRLKQDVQENTYHQTVLRKFMGIPKNKLANFFTDLRRREAPIHDFFVQLANSTEPDAKKNVLVLFKRIAKYLEENPIDASKIDIGKLKQAKITSTSDEETEGIEAKIEMFLNQNKKFYDGLNNILSSLKAQGDPPEKLELLEVMSPEKKMEDMIDRKERINRYIKTYNKTTDPKAKRIQRGDLRSAVELYVSQYNDLMTFVKSSGRGGTEASPDGQLNMDQTQKLKPDELPPRQQEKVKNVVLKSVAKAKEDNPDAPKAKIVAQAEEEAIEQIKQEPEFEDISDEEIEDIINDPDSYPDLDDDEETTISDLWDDDDPMDDDDDMPEGWAEFSSNAKRFEKFVEHSGATIDDYLGYIADDYKQKKEKPETEIGYFYDQIAQGIMKLEQKEGYDIDRAKKRYEELYKLAEWLEENGFVKRKISRIYPGDEFDPRRQEVEDSFNFGTKMSGKILSTSSYGLDLDQPPKVIIGR